MDPLLREKLKSELPGIYPRLLAYTVSMLRRSAIRKRLKADMKTMAEDLVQEAVVRTWDGSRVWKPERCDLLRFLHEAVRSLIETEVASPGNRSVAFDPIAHDSESGSAEDALLRREDELAEDDGAQAIVDIAGDDAVARKVAEAMIDGQDKPAEIAERLGIPVVEVYNASRRIRRRMAARFKKEA